MDRGFKEYSRCRRCGAPLVQSGGMWVMDKERE
jgi:hypothetical protein